MKLSERILQRYGKENVSARSKWGKILQAQGVQKTAEWMRIDRLPRRNWEQAKDLEELRQLLTDVYFKGDCKGCKACDFTGRMVFKAAQAAALRDLHDCNGLLAPVTVGGGKTLISLMAGRVLGAKRPLLLVPASLRDQTRVEAIPLYGRHFQIADNLTILGYSELSVESGADILARYEPDLIIADEAHRLKNLRAACTKEVKKYMDTHPYTRVALMSGTMTKRSLLDYWHLSMWSLKPDLMPLPRTWPEVMDWSRALDVKVEDNMRQQPGALQFWCKEGETARQGFMRRLTETPGVIATTGADGVDASLKIIGRKPPLPDKIFSMISKMRKNWETPNGEIITEAVELWRHARALACGFWQKWDPAAPPEWLEARREWSKYVRETLLHNRRDLTRPLQVWNEVERTGSSHKAWNVFSKWNGVKDSFTPHSVPQWVSTYLVEWAANWMETDVKKDPGIVWVEHVAFGEALAEYTGRKYFGAGDHTEILKHTEPMIASIQAHGEGRNLQRYRRGLVVAPPNLGSTWQQLLGRTHRHGQEADEVEWHVCLHTPELLASFNQARADAKYREETMGQQEKLLLANFVLDEVSMLSLEEFSNVLKWEG